MVEGITKKELAAKLGISRPTLDKYLSEGFPKKLTDSFTGNVEKDDEYEKIILENEIRVVKYTLKKLEERLKEISR